MAAMVALLGFAGWQPAAHAFQLFGITFFERRGDPADEPIGEPWPYSVEFEVVGGDRAAERRLRSASDLWGNRDEPASGAAGLVASARGDYRRLLAALYAEGRYAGAITILIDGREAAELPPDAAIANPASVSVRVDPGPVFAFRQAEIVNRAPAPADRGDVVPAPEDEGFRAGEVARSGAILRAEQLAVEAWRQQGHAKAEIADRRVEAAHDVDVIDARIVVAPGARAVYGPLGVEGAERMDEEFIRYMAKLPEGQEYDPDDLRRATDRLSRLDVFRSLRIQEADAIGPGGFLPLTAYVQERPLRRFGFGANYSTLDGFGVEGYWLHRNLFGRAERLRLEARVAGIDGLDPARYTYRVGAHFTKPGVFNPDTNFTASILGDREVLRSYTRTGGTIEAGFVSRFSDRFADRVTGRLFATGGYAHFEDPVFGRRDFVHAGLLGGIVYDTRDVAADATRGIYAEFVAEPFYEFNYANAAARFTAEARAYLGLGADSRAVLAARLKLGSLVGPPIAQTAPDRLFFAGGGGSVRGYAFRNIGVTAPGGQVIGGRSLIEGSVELRGRITETIGAVAFVDAGYVSDESFPVFNQDLRVGAGVGLRYLTGLGPIRLDAAVPLNPRPGDPSMAFYIGIGQAF